MIGRQSPFRIPELLRVRLGAILRVIVLRAADDVVERVVIVHVDLVELG